MTEEFLWEWLVLVMAVVPQPQLSPFPVLQQDCAKRISVSLTVVVPPRCIPFPAYVVISGSIKTGLLMYIPQP